MSDRPAPAVRGRSGVSVRGGPGVLDWVLVVLLCLLAGVIAVFGVFFLPLYVGAVPVPVVVVPVAGGLLVLPRLTFRLTGAVAAAMAPAAVWFAVTVVLYLITNGLYLGVPVAWRGWQFALLVGVGAIAAATSIGLLWGDELAARDPPVRRPDAHQGR